MSGDNLNVNYSRGREINNKPMRLSKLQKWILAHVEKKPDEESKALTSMIKGFSPKTYYYISRTAIMYGYLSNSYIRRTKFEIYRNGKLWIPIHRANKRKAEVILSRSLEAMEEHGLIIRVGHFRFNLLNAIAIRSGMKNKPMAELLEEIKGIDPKRVIERFVRVEDYKTKTKGILLTDKGIEIRNRILAEVDKKEAS